MRSKLNKFLDGCPKWVQDEVWGENGMRAEIEQLQQRNAELERENKELRKERLLFEQTIDDRDNNEEWANKLAGCIAEILQVDIGEHSSANNPWHEAVQSWNIKNNRVASLERERDELAAYVDRVKQYAKEISGLEPSISALLRMIEEESPQKSLVKRDALVARQAINDAAKVVTLVVGNLYVGSDTKAEWNNGANFVLRKFAIEAKKHGEKLNRNYGVKG